MITFAPDKWLTEFGDAWRRLDPGAVAHLFTPSAVYHPHPHQLPITGRDAITDYWVKELAGIDSVDVSWGEPIIDRRRVAVDYQAIARGPNTQTLDSGVLLLRFEANLCSELHEYWMIRDLTSA